MKNGGHTALVCLETGIKIPFLEIDKMWWDRSPKLKKLIWKTDSKWDHFNINMNNANISSEQT